MEIVGKLDLLGFDIGKIQVVVKIKKEKTCNQGDDS